MSPSSTGVNSTVCWFPDRTTNGAVNSPEFVPCNPSAHHSACCAAGESCLGQGLCYSDLGKIYRGGCTDRTWADAACAVVCTSSQAGINFGVQNSYQFLSNCGAYDFICNSNATFCTTQPTYVLTNLKPGPVLQVNITGNVTTSSSSSAAKSGTVSPTALASSSSNHSMVVGVGVGVPLAVALVSAIIWALWERSRRLKGMQGSGSAKADSSRPQHNWGFKRVKDPVIVSELDTKEKRRAYELQ